jgi:hypothetical protein
MQSCALDGQNWALQLFTSPIFSVESCNVSPTKSET